MRGGVRMLRPRTPFPPTFTPCLSAPLLLLRCMQTQCQALKLNPWMKAVLPKRGVPERKYDSDAALYISLRLHSPPPQPNMANLK